MKKVLLIMAAALLMMTQCRKPETPSANTIKMTVTVGPGAKTNITDNGAITWTLGDKLYVSDGTKWLGSLNLDSGVGSATGTFTGSISEIIDGTTCHFFYLGHDNGMTAPEANTTTDVSISFASQDGTRVGALKYHLGHGIADVTVIGDVATGAVRMKTEIAIAHLILKMNGEDYTGSVTMDVSNTMTVSPDGTFSGSGNGIAIGNNGGTSGDRYVTLIPTEATNVSFSGFATGSMTFGHGIQANNLYGMANGIEVTLTAAHEYVDLGLPSGLLWATCNLGAEHPYDYGKYYAWGETAGYNEEMVGAGANCGASYSPGTVKTKYGWDYYKWGSGPMSLGKYVNKTGYGMATPDNLTTLLPEDDAATANWGGDWRMPSAGNFDELINNTTQTWKAAGVSIEIGEQTVSMPVAGYYCVSTKSGYTDKYIFLPAAGFRTVTGLNSAGSAGDYWSRSLKPAYPDKGSTLNFKTSSLFRTSAQYRSFGHTVRPVCPPQN